MVEFNRMLTWEVPEEGDVEDHGNTSPKILRVARYKGKGRHPGFQNFKLVDVDVLVLGEERRIWQQYLIHFLFKVASGNNILFIESKFPEEKKMDLLKCSNHVSPQECRQLKDL
ncbi:hypothetical protein POM88_020446 [Heracleum sosnowskyi]|uniref:Uncharacterized protein n=1 Tax=Heracleum sosnowskyi TaxID=360622 RepID=A0AAD8MRE6_9APIA|nr:hypothetical protein POM88_020446 [Heracleum sosnowskyi]